jgi:hypothetical protein
MAQQRTLAFITAQRRESESLEASLLGQAEAFVRLGRCNIIVVVDTLPTLDAAAMAALQTLQRRISELGAECTCVALDERVFGALRDSPLGATTRIIRRVEQIPATAAA